LEHRGQPAGRPVLSRGKAFDLDVGPLVKWDGDVIIKIFAFRDSALRAPVGAAVGSARRSGLGADWRDRPRDAIEKKKERCSMILVTTAGKVGSEAVRLLRQRALPVRVLVRNRTKGEALAEVGAEIVEGDLEAPLTLDDAMVGVTTVVLVSAAVPAQEINIIHSAVRAGVTHVVKITSDATADSPIARRRGQAEIEAALAAAELGHTLLRSNFYMQNFLALAPAIVTTSGFGSSTGAGRLGLIDARDVGAVAAAIAASPSPHVGKIYRLTGLELLSYADVAAVLSTVLGRSITYRELSVEDDKDAMIRGGVPAPIAAMNAQALSLVATGDAAWLSDDVLSLLGRPPRSFAQFAADYAAAFS